MWQPNKSQWRIIWIVSVLLVLFWPPEHGRSLAIKTANWLADPSDSLIVLPAQLPIGIDDNGDAVAAHDALQAEYYRQFESSHVTRLRMKLKAADEPFDPWTERQILVGIAVLSALGVWKLNGKGA
jgi:hypothetical protein